MARWGRMAGALAVIGVGCAGVHPIQSDVDADPGSLRVALVEMVATRAEVIQHPEFHQMLLAAGISNEQLSDGSVIQTRVHCCDGPDVITFGGAYVPPGIQVARGDVVEIRVATDPEADGTKRLNVVTQVRQPAEAKPSHCSWVPAEPGLWRRTLYCDWMPVEGWTEIRSYGLPILWTKPAPN